MARDREEGGVTGGRANTEDFLCILKQETLAIFNQFGLSGLVGLLRRLGGAEKWRGTSLQPNAFYVL